MKKQKLGLIGYGKVSSVSSLPLMSAQKRYKNEKTILRVLQLEGANGIIINRRKSNYVDEFI